MFYGVKASKYFCFDSRGIDTVQVVPIVATHSTPIMYAHKHRLPKPPIAAVAVGLEIGISHRVTQETPQRLICGSCGDIKELTENQNYVMMFWMFWHILCHILNKENMHY